MLEMTSSDINNVSIENNVEQETLSCPTCTRNFFKDRLSRHLTVCKKQAQKKRNIFDSSKQRTPVDGKGETISSLQSSSTLAKTTSAKIDNYNNQMIESKKSSWREAHEEFINTVRKARGLKVEEDDNDNGKKIPAGYVKCPFCERTFNKNAGERHILWCKEQKAQIPRTLNHDTVNRFKNRTKYKSTKVRKNQDLEESHKTISYESNDKATKSLALRNIKNSQRFRSPSRGDDLNGIKSRLRLDEVKTKQTPKTPIMKFKEKFPNHAKSEESITSKILKNAENIKDILKRPESFSGPTIPKTVPGVRTRGLSPIRVNNQNLNIDQIDFNSFKSKIDDIYSSRMNIKLNEKGLIDKIIQSFSQNGSRSSTPKSSEEHNSNTLRSVSSKMESNETVNKILPQFCHQCGTKYPILEAKYCHECGERRLRTQ